MFMPGGEAEVVFVESRPVLAEIGGINALH